MSLSDNCVLITGGNGFIGSHLARHLLNEGYEVHLLLRKSSVFKYFEPDLVKAVRWNFIDPTDITHAVHTSKCNTIFHCAANMEEEVNESAVQRLIEANFSFGTYLIHAASNADCKYFINTGTYWQYNQDSSQQPNTLYAALKEIFQSLLTYYCNRFLLSASNLILHNVYGDNDKRKKILDLFLQAGLSKQVLHLSPGEQILDFVHVLDVVKAYKLAWAQLKECRFNNVQKYHVRHEQYSLKEIAQLFETIGLKIDCDWGSLSYQKTQIMRPYCGPTIPEWKPEEKLTTWIEKQMNLQKTCP